VRVAWGGGCLTAGDLDLPAHHGLLVVNAGNGTVPVEHASFAIMLKWPPIMGISAHYEYSPEPVETTSPS
jgi:hypothetical protein